ncbi:MAG: sporulation protein [Oscillospiraceae bacterium]|jgi:sporulation integral membrane protein YlbJ|nr:sporulation protein [Oscillospiraceae bacterium]
MLRLLRQKKVRDALAASALLIATAALVISPGEAINGAKDGLALCFNVIVPSLFPFFVLSSLVVDLGLAAYLGRAMEGLMRPLFRVSGSCAAAVALGFIGGYPVGARTALQLYEQGLCSKTEAERLLAFCNNSGPAFILGVVGAGVFGDSRVGLLLYLTHALASLLVGLLFRFYGGWERRRACAPRPKPIQTVTLPAAFTGAVSRALQSTLNICAFVVFFAVVLRLLSAYGALSGAAALLSLAGFEGEWARRLVAGLLELSSGVASLQGGAGLAGRVSMAAFMLGWAGLSVHCQVLSFLVDSGLSARVYLAGKLCHGLIAAALTWGLTRLFPLSAPVADYLVEQTESIAALDFSTALAASTLAALAGWLILAWLCGPLLQKSCGKSRRHGV